MPTFQVSLLHNQTLQGKQVVVEARDEDHAFFKAKQMQTSPGRWATILAKPQGEFKSRFQHKGLARR